MKEFLSKYYTKLSIAHLLLFVITVYPLISVEIAPLVDWPNHLAKSYIVANIAKSSILQQQYTVSFSFFPYMAIDSILSTLARFMSIYAAGKLFLLLTCAAIVFAVTSLQLSLFKKVNYTSLLVYPFIYSGPMAWGFINFLFSSALAIMIFALWIAKEQRWSRWFKLVCFAAMAIILLLSHAYAFLLFGVLFFFYQCQTTIVNKTINWQQSLQACFDGIVIFTPALFVYLCLPPSNLSIQQTSYQNLQAYLMGLFSPLYYNSESLPYTILLISLFFIWSLLFSAFNVAKKMSWTLTALLLISVITPTTLMGVFLSNYRMPLMLCLIYIGSIDFSTLKLTRLNALFLILFSLISFCRTIAIDNDIQIKSQLLNEYRQASKLMQPGLPQLALYDSKSFLYDVPYFYYHIQMLGVIENAMYSAALFSYIQTYVSVNKPYSAINPPTALPRPLSLLDLPAAKLKKQKSFIANWRKKFAYLLIFHTTAPYKLPSGNLHLLYQGKSFSIYKNNSFLRLYTN